MPIILVANPKGGAGKSTLATNIAGYFASQGHQAMLGDTDRQQSARSWLARRPQSCSAIGTWEIDEKNIARPPRNATHVVIDSAAGLHGWRLQELLALADRILVPIQPSMFDIDASQHFLHELTERLSAPVSVRKVAIVGMRVKARTRAAEQLEQFVAARGLPILTYLRDTQNYIQLAAHGLTLFDVAPSRVQQDREQWQPIIDWLG
ncbi:MAG: ParA family protein [Burkholderiaceae bacterium]|nr:MAG: ParA family protein [Burkholderiaceae bacterium]